MHDIIVVGGGPAGLTAAIYAVRAGKKVLVIEKDNAGGQITHSPMVDNYPALPHVSGAELGAALMEQAQDMGAQFDFAQVTGVKKQQDAFLVETDFGNHSCKAVVLATGARHRMLGLEGEEDLIGCGVSFCAVCDGAFYAGQKVAVAGGGNSALQEAILLSDVCSEVVMVQDMDVFTGESCLVSDLKEKSNVSTVFGTRITGLVSENGELTALELSSEREGESRLKVAGLFVAIGMAPENEAFVDVAHLDERGYFLSDESCLTATPGVFVAGDCRQKKIRQLTTAVADGAVAGLAAVDFVNGR